MNFSAHKQAVFKDAFNLFCGAKIGEGTYREVFECKIRDDMVVKVERDNGDFRTFHNVAEAQFWSDAKDVITVKDWLAPIYSLSPDGLILLQAKTTPVPKADLPDKLPRFLTDIKPENFGMFEGRIVTFDYAFTITEIKTKLRSVHW